MYEFSTYLGHGSRPNQSSSGTRRCVVGGELPKWQVAVLLRSCDQRSNQSSPTSSSQRTISVGDFPDASISRGGRGPQGISSSRPLCYMSISRGQHSRPPRTRRVASLADTGAAIANQRPVEPAFAVAAFGPVDRRSALAAANREQVPYFDDCKAMNTNALPAAT